MRVVLYLILLLMVVGCRDNKKKHLRTLNLCNKNAQSKCKDLHLEIFSDLGVGLPGSDLTYDYLTDSSSFRLFIGKYDDISEILTTDIKGDSVLIVKSTMEGQSQEWQNHKILERKVYSLKMLKKQGKFD